MFFDLGKTAIVFYGSYIDIFNLFPEETQREMALSVLQVAFARERLTMQPEMSEVLRPILEGIWTQRERYKKVKLFEDCIYLLQIKSVSISSQDTRQAFDNAIKELKRAIVRCKKKDTPLEVVKSMVYSVFSDPVIFEESGITEEWLDRIMPKEELRIPKADKTARPDFTYLDHIAQQGRRPK